MNMSDSEEELTKLVNQLARRVPNLELDSDVVKSQVVTFKETEAALLEKLSSGSSKPETKEEAEESAVAKLVEEMKALPSRVAERLAEGGDPNRRRRPRRIHPMMIEELMHVSGEHGDPMGILIAASVARDDMPWLYEFAMEVYRAVKHGNVEVIEREMKRFRGFTDLIMHGPFAEELGMGSKDSYMFARDFYRMLEHMVAQAMEMKGDSTRRRLKTQHDTGPA
jgi:hypothetical protein